MTNSINFAFHADRWQATRDNYRAWWAGEMDRPLIHLTLLGRDPGRPEPALISLVPSMSRAMRAV